jgi:hypothetical protein
MHEIAGTINDNDPQGRKSVDAAGLQTAHEQLQNSSQLVAHNALLLGRKNAQNPYRVFFT